MSAIAGICYRDGRDVDRTHLESMVDVLAHRGQDACGVWTDGPVGLGSRALWTTCDSMREELPLTDGTRDLAITADARIDNSEQLLDALGLSGKKTADVALILAAYAKWGQQCPQHLLGDFAFAIWDRRSETLFCARDHFGVKPFYYHLSAKVFAFASEIKGLFALPEVPRRLDEVRVGYHLASTFDDRDRTFYEDVRRLSPAHSLTVGPGRAGTRSYWSLSPSRELQLSCDRDYAEGFRERFTEAVRCRLPSSHPVGSLLSGGLDSSAITCVAQDLLAQEGDRRLTTFSAVFDEVTQCDERPFINAVLARNGLEPHYVHGDQMSPLVDLDRVLWHQDEPLYSFNLFLNWGLYAAANRQGVRVLLDGFDGDTTVSHGAGYLSELAAAGRWLALVREVWGFARSVDASPWKLTWDHVSRYGFSRLAPVRWPLRPIRKVRAWRRRRRASSGGGQPASIFNDQFARRIGLVERIGGLTEAAPRTEREYHYQALTWGVMPYTLEVLDRASAAFAIEPRYPFWDRRLVEFCLALPPEQKIRRGWTRRVMRQGLRGILPEEVRRRRGKSNLGPNFEHTLLAFERDRLEAVAAGGCKAIEEYVDMAALRSAYGRLLTRPTGDDVTAVWKATTLALWLSYSGARA